MSKENDGGGAFPLYVPSENYVGSETVTGISVRDYFAAKALQGLCADHMPNTATAEAAYRLADAMLAAREK